MKCPLCQAENSQVLYRGVKDFEHGVTGQADFYQCVACGLVFQNPVPSAERLKSFYPADYLAYSSKGLVSRLKDLQALMLFNSLASDLPGKDAHIFELGCGGGHLLKQLKNHGYRNLSALDWNDDLAPIFKGLGISFAAGNIEEQKFSGKYEHRQIEGGIGHNLPQEAPQPFVQAIIDVAGT